MNKLKILSQQHLKSNCIKTDTAAALFLTVTKCKYIFKVAAFNGLII